MYTIKKYAQSPFNKDEHGIDLFILCDKESGEPVAEIGKELPWYAKEGDLITQAEVVLTSISKKSKYLVVGDKISIGHFIEGVVESIEPSKEGEWSWDDKVRISGCKVSNPSFAKTLEFSFPESQTLSRTDCEAKEWLHCDVVYSENHLWERIKNDWMEYDSGKNMNTDEIMQFFRDRTTPRS